MQKCKTLKGIGRAIEVISILSLAGFIVYDFIVLNTLGITDLYYLVLGLVMTLIGFSIEFISDVLFDITYRQVHQKKATLDVSSEKTKEEMKQEEKVMREKEIYKPTTIITPTKKENKTVEKVAEPAPQVQKVEPIKPVQAKPVQQVRASPQQVKPTVQQTVPVQQAKIKPVQAKPIQRTTNDESNIKSFFSRDERYADVDRTTDASAKQFIQKQRELSFNQTDMHDGVLPFFDGEIDEDTFNDIKSSVYEEPRKTQAKKVQEPVDAFGGLEVEEDMTARLKRLSKKKNSFKTIDLN